MKNFDWKTLLRRHPLFSSLNEDEIEQLLKDEVSAERQYHKGSLILREGEFGDSIFLVGSGSIKALLLREGGREVTLSILRQGEFFGEMAVFEKRPRAATVIAHEDCTLLEIKGQEFLQLVTEHPDIEFKLVSKLSERLRHANEELFAVRLKDVDEKLNSFDTKLEAELKVIAASVTEVRAMTDHTKSRADDIVNSFERTRIWVTWIAWVLGGIITVGGYFGGSYVYKYADQIKTLYNKAKENADALENWRRQKDTLSHQISIEFDQKLWKLKPDDLDLTLRLLSKVETVIADQPEYSRLYTGLLQNISEKAKSPEVKIYASYVLLANQILAHHKSFTVHLSTFEKYLSKYKDQKGEIDFSVLEDLFAEEDKEKRESFQRLKDLIATR